MVVVCTEVVSVLLTAGAEVLAAGAAGAVVLVSGIVPVDVCDDVMVLVVDEELLAPAPEAPELLAELPPVELLPEELLPVPDDWPAPEAPFELLAGPHAASKRLSTIPSAKIRFSFLIVEILLR